MLQALEDISADEQLTVSYGNLSNMHLVQKYGFTMMDEEQAKLNVVNGSYPFGDYQQIVYEEQRLKQELSQKKQIPYNSERFLGLSFFPNRFDPSLLARLRLSFLTSQTIMDKGGTKIFNDTIDFQSDFDQFNEECSVQYLIDAI